MIHSHFVSWGPENVYWNRRPMIPVISVLKIPFQPPICRLVLWGGCATMCYLPRLILNSPNWDSVKSPRFFPCILGYLGYLYFWDTSIFGIPYFSWLNAMPGGLPRDGLIPRGFGDLFADERCPCRQMDLRRIDGGGLHVCERT